jgi:cyclic beta-1,2-glucan synthetase
MGTDTVPINISPPRDRIGELALELAQILTIDEQAIRDYPLPAQLDALEKHIQNAYEAFEEASRNAQSTILPAAEWILDNYYVIEQALAQIKMGMPADYYRRLPKASLSGGKKLARVYILSKALVQSTQGRFEIGIIKDFVLSYQNILPLKIGEIWAFPIMLRLCVLEMLALSLANIRQIPFASAYSQIVFHFEGEPDDDPNSPLTLPDDNIVANCVISLRMLSTQDWKAFFDQVSLVEQALSEDPAGVYPVMDFETRNSYRNIVEQIADDSPWDELKIAHAAVAFASRGANDREGHVGFYLVGLGRKQLETESNYRVPPDQRFLRWLETHAMLAYLGGVLVLTALFSLPDHHICRLRKRDSRPGYYRLLAGSAASISQCSLHRALGSDPYHTAAHLAKTGITAWSPARIQHGGGHTGHLQV